MPGILNIFVWSHEIGEIHTEKKKYTQKPSVLARFEPAL